MTGGGSGVVQSSSGGLSVHNLLLALPYFVVLVSALCGVDVMVALAAGLLLAAVVGLAGGSMDFASLWQAMADGISGMSDLILVTMLAGGIMAMIRGYIIRSGRSYNPRRTDGISAQLGLAILVMAVDCVTANNTVAILTVGDFARGVGERCGIPPRRVASILDTFSCIAQSIIPWGAQLLIAAGLASVSPTAIIPYLYYPAVLAVVCVIGIVMSRHGGKPLPKDA